jgi:hypothetical protein
VAWQGEAFNLGAGSHTVTWIYEKDISVSSGSDAGWLDQVAWTTGTVARRAGCDFDGDGATDFGCYYGPGAKWYFYKSSEGYSGYQFGPANATPLTGDFDGDGAMDFGCYYGPGAKWYLIKSSEGYGEYQFGPAMATPLNTPL